MTKELKDLIDSKVDEKRNKLRSVYGSFHSITDKLKNTKVSPDFWIKERENTNVL